MVNILTWIFGILFVLSFVIWCFAIAYGMFFDINADWVTEWIMKGFSIVIVTGVLFGIFGIWNSSIDDTINQNQCQKIGGHYEIVGHYTSVVKGVTTNNDLYGCVK